MFVLFCFVLFFSQCRSSIHHHPSAGTQLVDGSGGVVVVVVVALVAFDGWMDLGRWKLATSPRPTPCMCSQELAKLN
jgi:hypothetical protein